MYNFKGNYSSSLNYDKLDVVIYKKSINHPKLFFLCITEHINQEPNPNSDTDYWVILYSDSVFPDNIDFFIPKTNIQANDKENVINYQVLMLKESRTPAEDDELNQLSDNLKDKLLTPESFNRLQSALSNMQMFIKNSVEGYINQKQLEFQAEVNKFTYEGVYNSSKQYYTKNYVTYNDGTGINIYICIQNAIGIVPTNTTYWRVLGIKGPKGNDGVGLLFKGAWDSTVTYNENEAVQFSGVIFGALQSNYNQMPNLVADTIYWAKVWDIGITVNQFIGTRSISTNTSNINFVTGDILNFNPSIDVLEVYKDGDRLTRGIHYTININNQSIDKIGGTWDGTSVPIFFEFVVTRNQISNLVFSDGQTIENGTITRDKFTLDVQEDLDKFNNHLIDETPHQFTDGITTYRWGLQVQDGHMVLVYEEVV